MIKPIEIKPEAAIPVTSDRTPELDAATGFSKELIRTGKDPTTADLSADSGLSIEDKVDAKDG